MDELIACTVECLACGHQYDHHAWVVCPVCRVDNRAWLKDNHHVCAKP